MCEHFAIIGLILSKRFAANQLSNFKIYNAASLQSFMLLDIVENEAVCTINDIKTNSVPGPEGFPTKFIKMTQVVLVSVLMKLYNKYFTEKRFPDDFKLSHVILICKTAAPK